jgi:membrane complex biogenesis BtpA family protein
MVENFGDTPFYADTAPPETVAAMAVAVDAVRRRTELPVGVNVLRNDVMSALGVATAADAAFVRVNILTGTMYTDQGPITGRAADALRKRAGLGVDVEIWADVMVKHSTPPPGLTASQAAVDTLERGLADALIVSGAGTGTEPDLARLREVEEVVPTGTRLVIGSGANPDNLSTLLTAADTVIIGSALKVGGDARNRVDPERAARLVEAAREIGLL